MKYLNFFLSTKLTINKLCVLGFFIGVHKQLKKVIYNKYLLGYKQKTVIFNLEWSLFLFKKAFYFFKSLLLVYRICTVFVVNDDSNVFNKSFRKNIKLTSGKIRYFFYKTDIWKGGELSNVLNPKLFQAKKYFFPHVVIVLKSKHYKEIAHEARCLKIPSIGFVDANMNLVFDYNIPLGITNIKNGFFFRSFIEKFISKF
jgi:ribosomal protein S2